MKRLMFSAASTGALFAILLGFMGSAVSAGEIQCQQLFEGRKPVATFLARQRLMKQLGPRTQAAQSQAGGVTSISNPRPEIQDSVRISIPDSVRFRYTHAQEAIAVDFLASANLFLQKISSSQEIPADPKSVVLSALFSVALGRYTDRIFVGVGSERVELSGQAIVLMAEIIHAVREIENPARAAAIAAAYTRPTYYSGNPRAFIFGLENSAAYSSHEPTVNQKAEPPSGSALGLRAKEIDGWFKEALRSAQEDRGERRVVTPGLILRTFVAGIRRGTISSDNAEVQAKFVSVARRVFNEILLPRLEKDFDEAALRSDLTVRSAYAETVEVLASPGLKSPQLEDVKQIKSLYRGPRLTAEVIASMRADLRAARPAGVNEELLEAAKRHFVVYKSGFRPRYSYQDFVDYSRTGIGDRELEAASFAFVNELIRMGYSHPAVLDALTLLASGPP